jgi:hypothetical protein
MKNLLRVFLILLIGSFPVSAYIFLKSQSIVEVKTKAPEKEIALKPAADVEELLQLKVKEISELEVKTLSAKDDMLRYQEQKQIVIKTLEDLRQRIGPIIEQARNSDQSPIRQAIAE